MKKHPIDELFAGKLAEHRQEPSQKAFEKFQERLQQKQSKRGGGVFAIQRNWAYYAAAAGVVAVLTIGVLSQSNTTNTQVALNNSKTHATERVAVPEEINDEKPSNTTKVDAIIKGAVESYATIRPGDMTERAINNSTKQIAVVEENAFTENNQLAVAPTTNQAVITSPFTVETLAAKNTLVLPNESASVATKYNIGEAATMPSTLDEQPGLIATNKDAETAEMEEKAEKEKSFLAKLYGEYKNFKYGEKVDLKKLGMKDAVARVDEGLFKEERDDVRDFVQRRISRMQKRD